MQSEACSLRRAVRRIFLELKSDDLLWPTADEKALQLALTAGLSLLLVILLATCIGTTVPLFLHRAGVDPAIATGPFITTSNDILGLTVFFVIATLIYL